MRIHNHAWRMLERMKTYSIISLTGLIISLTGTVIIARYVHQELTVDYYVDALDRTFLLTEHHKEEIQLSSNKDWNKDPGFVDPLNSPAVECHSRFILIEEGGVNYNEINYQARIIPTDSLFLKILPRRVLAGNATISSPADAVITQTFARHLFGGENPIGKSLKTANKIVTVTGVIDEPATKSSINYDLLISKELNNMWEKTELSIVRLHSKDDAAKLNAAQKPLKLSMHEMEPITYQLHPLSDFYFDESVDIYQKRKGIMQGGNIRNVWVLIFVAIMLFVAGMFNYLNIYTVMMLKRSRELGIKKVYGASLWQILGQIYTENFYLSAAALFFVWTIIEATGGWFASEFDIPVLSNARFDLWLSLGILFIFPLITSLPPACRYARAAPVTSIRSVSFGGRSVVSRSIFLFLQYIITFCLIVIAVYFMKQLDFMLHSDLGYHTENIIECTIYPDNHRDAMYSTDEEWEQERTREQHIIDDIIREMDACRLFQEWTFGENFQQLTPYINIKKADSDQEYRKVAFASFSNVMMDIFDIKLTAGRRWNDSTDVFEQYKLIVNEAALKLLDIQDIHQDRLQTERRIWWSMGVDEGKNPPFEIVGVIKDFNTNHLSKETVPLISTFEPNRHKNVYKGTPIIARIVPGKKQEVIRFLTDLHNRLLGDGELNYSFIEDQVAAMYENDRRTSRIYITFATMAILVSCLGLLGLSLFDIRQRYREIALRKVNGAGLKDIIPLIMKKYIYILACAIVTATPLSYFVIQKYMEGFANRAPLSWWIYPLAAIIVLAVTLGTLFWQVNKAVRVNPATIMKTE